MYFRRFSSKISSDHTESPEKYIREIAEIARSIFGYERIIFWTTYGSEEETNAHYTWKEVHDAEKEARLEFKSNKETTTENDPLQKMINEANKFAVEHPLQELDLQDFVGDQENAADADWFPRKQKRTSSDYDSDGKRN